MGAGIVLVGVIIISAIAFNRRQSKAQLEYNKLSFAQMEEGNRLRKIRADAMERIAESIDQYVRRSL